jgi:glycosyltransferase involved in cell wall biosynthesis
MRMNTIFVYPNYAIQFYNNSYFLESSHALLLSPLLKNNYEITIIGILDEYSTLGNYNKLFSNDINLKFLSKIRSKQNKFQKIFNYIFISFKSIITIRKSLINYIFIPGNIGIIIALLSFIFKHPYALYYRGDWEEKTPIFLKGFMNMLFKNAKFIIYVGAIRDDSIFKLNTNSEVVIPMLSVPIKFYHYKLKNLPINTISVLFIGEICVEKGIYELVNSILNLIRDGYKDITLTIVGNGIEFNNLKNLIIKLDVKTNIKLLGKINDPELLIKLYQTNDIFCLPSYSEGFPRVLYEAMMFSVPIITTNVGKIGTLLDYNNAIFIKKKCEIDLENKLRLLINDQNLRHKIAINAFNTITPFLEKWKNLKHGDQFLYWLNLSKV